jgi:hypothetical protein
MVYSNDIFEKIARQEFRFLESEYDFKLHGVEKTVYGCFIIYKASALAVRVSCETHDGGVFVKIYKLKDGEIPKYPIFFDPKAEYLIFNFNNLLLLRAKRVIEQDEERIYKDSEYLKATVKQFADNLKLYGSDVLKGDFGILPELHKIVIRRAKELEDEI